MLKNLLLQTKTKVNHIAEYIQVKTRLFSCTQDLIKWFLVSIQAQKNGQIYDIEELEVKVQSAQIFWHSTY